MEEEQREEQQGGGEQERSSGDAAGGCARERPERSPAKVQPKKQWLSGPRTDQGSDLITHESEEESGAEAVEMHGTPDAIVRGLARIVERAATGGETGGQAGGPASSLEWSQDCV